MAEQTHNNSPGNDTTPFEKFRNLAVRLFDVSKKEQDEALRKDKEARAEDEHG